MSKSNLGKGNICYKCSTLNQIASIPCSSILTQVLSSSLTLPSDSSPSTKFNRNVVIFTLLDLSVADSWSVFLKLFWGFLAFQLYFLWDLLCLFFCCCCFVASISAMLINFKFTVPVPDCTHRNELVHSHHLSCECLDNRIYPLLYQVCSGCSSTHVYE